MTQVTVSDAAKALHTDAIVIDGCSFFYQGWTERMELSGITALQVGCGIPKDNARGVIKRIEAYYKYVREDDRVGIVETTEDIRAFKRAGKVGFILGAQRPYFLEDDPGLVEVFQRLGVRFMQIAYSERSLLADGCFENTNVGLSHFGRDVIREMNRVGIQVDLSHVGERSTLEAIEISEKPCIFSHSNPKARADHPRNITDEQIKLCAAAGGVIGVSPYPPICWTGGAKAPSIDDVVDHLEYIVELTGIDHVSIGTDSEATPGGYPPELTLHHANSYPEIKAKFAAAHPNVKKNDGFASMDEFPNLTAKLLDRGWSNEDIKKVLGENLMRAYKASWGA